MSGWLWLIAAGVGFGLFALGYVAAIMWRGGHDRAYSVLGVIFVIIALVVMVDLVSVQNRQKATVDCNTALINAATVRNQAQETINAVAIDYDTEMRVLLDDLADGQVRAGDPEFGRVQATLEKLMMARHQAIAVEHDHPLPNCR